MSTIVEYRDGTPPANRYPTRITSPTQARACCEFHMTFLGEPRWEGRIQFQYKRCTCCGFTVRVILGEQADPQLLAALRETLAHAFTKGGTSHA
jgi:hypothetical protein